MKRPGRLSNTFKPEISHVPVSGKVIGGDEMGSLVDYCLDFCQPADRFNIEIVKSVRPVLGRKTVLTFNTGSSANLLAMAALTSPILGARAF